MAVWLTYDLRDFLLFSNETYWRLFELTNTAVWPLPIVCAVFPFWLMRWIKPAPPMLKVALIFAAAGGVVLTAELFIAARYQLIHWAMAYVRPLFWLQAIFLAILGYRLVFPSTGLRYAAGLAYLAMAGLYPWLGLTFGRTLAQGEVFAIAPDPTMIGLIGLLLVAKRSALTVALSLFPITWLVLSAVTLNTLQEMVWVVPACLALLGLVLIARR